MSVVSDMSQTNAFAPRKWFVFWLSPTPAEVPSCGITIACKAARAAFKAEDESLLYFLRNKRVFKMVWNNYNGLLRQPDGSFFETWCNSVAPCTALNMMHDRPRMFKNLLLRTIRKTLAWMRLMTGIGTLNDVRGIQSNQKFLPRIWWS